MLRTLKVRLYPNNSQQEQLSQYFGSVRWVFNECLSLSNLTYKTIGKSVSKYDMLETSSYLETV